MFRHEATSGWFGPRASSQISRALLHLIADTPRPDRQQRIDGNGRPQLVLRRGEIWEFTENDRPLLTQVGSATVRVVAAPNGASLNLRLTQNGTILLLVVTGDAWFSSGGRDQLVTAGSLSVAEAGQEPTRPITVAVNVPFIVDLPPNLTAREVPLSEALLAGRIDELARLARDDVRTNPGLGRAHYWAGLALAEQGQLDRAAAELKRAIALDARPLSAQALLARVYTEEGRQAEAFAVVQQAVKLDPKFVPAQEALGKIYWRAGRLEEARREYKKALGRAPTNPLYLTEFAGVYLDLNCLPAALELALRAVRAAPDSSEAHAVLGLVYDRMSNPEQALREYRESLSLSPDNGLARLGLGINSANPDERLRQLENLFRGNSWSAAPTSERISQSLASNTSMGDALSEVAQAMLHDPPALSRLLRPGLTTEVGLDRGSFNTSSLHVTHRDQYIGGALHDLTFGTQQWSDNYRNDQPERLTQVWGNLVAAPSYRTQVLGQYFYSGRDIALPGTTLNPDLDARSSFQGNWGDLTARYRADPATFVWLHAGSQLSHLTNRNPDAPEDLADPDLDTTEFQGIRLSHLSLEGRLDHRWRSSHIISYVLSAGQEHSDVQRRLYDSSQRGFVEEHFLGRDQVVAHTVQDDYRPSPHLSLIWGVTAERFTERIRSQTAVESTLASRTSNTGWFPFGQATYVLTQRDLVRIIAHKRRQHALDFVLKPAEAFLVGEPPPLALEGQTTNYEMDYERRFSARSFAKLFLFRSDVDDFLETTPVRQTVPLFGLFASRARAQGLGMRYEWKAGPFLSGYARYTYRRVTDPTGRFWEDPPSTPQDRNRQLPLNPRSRAVLGMSYLDSRGVKVYAEATWTDELFPDLPPGLRFPKSGTKLLVNLRFGRERTPRGEWLVRINNLLNTPTIYWRSPSDQGGVRDFPAPGRSLEFQYLIRF